MDIIRFITEETPVLIEQQEPKKFALFYCYSGRIYLIKIIIAVKSRFIDLPSVHCIKTERLEKLKRRLENEK
ncbi:hypothetical protein [Methanobrevibacter filiformis]|uniref:hypothetical protein n=1 Tax=Methanobrevibacter filiformis TaxID=55758 RepID=UPI0008370AB6|nr:hypothetical protein [Methanobrevibacter filiformis]